LSITRNVSAKLYKNPDFALQVSEDKIIFYCRRKKKYAAITIPKEGIPFLTREIGALLNFLYRPLYYSGIHLHKNKELQNINLVTFKLMKNIAETAIKRVQAVLRGRKRSFTKATYKRVKHARVIVNKRYNQVVIAFPILEGEHEAFDEVIPDRTQRNIPARTYATWRREHLGLRGYFIPVSLSKLWNGIEIYSGHGSLHDYQLTELLMTELKYEIEIVHGLFCDISRRGASQASFADLK